MLQVSPENSQDGVVKLYWSGADGQDIVLQRAMNKSFDHATTLYRGSDQASVQSGLGNGDYFFRVGDGQGAWSEPGLVKVQHHHLARAWAFLALGGLVFLSTVWLVLAGHRRG